MTAQIFWDTFQKAKGKTAGKLKAAKEAVAKYEKKHPNKKEGSK